jgi:predicted nuclease of predicted toxin-antitoxin system
VTIWLDNRLSPDLATWISATFEKSCIQVRGLGLSRAHDREIFERARQAGAVLISKDADFAGLVLQLGPPPSLIWLTCGNTSDRALREIRATRLPAALALIDAGEAIVEIGGDPR